MNDQQGRGPRGDEFEDIRILGLDSPDDDVEPGRSVFGAEPTAGDLPHWTEPPAADATGGGPVEDPWAGLEGTPRWSDDVPDDHESQQPVGEPSEAAAVFFDDGPLGSAGAAEFDPPLLPPDEPLPDLGRAEDVPAPRAEDPVPPTSQRPPGRGGSGGGRDIPLAIVSGVGLGALALVAFKIGAGATLALTTVLLVLAAAEFFIAVRRAGYQPAALLGIT
ncbi:MAG TPA: hypothetical protein DCY78_05495, partial [Acidimicrobiaceae bacterium]|nr:hypothetical protein [Acidimicrobiaceae bacterium]